MMRSLSSAVGGLRAHQTKMDVIGNNIANVNTYGFKASRTTFSDVYYQSLSSGSGPTNSTGGTNPTQIGYGASVATIDVLNTQSGMASTDMAMDVYLNGDGMIATKDTDGVLRYSRLGSLGFDALGNLVDKSGNFVMGFPMDKTGNPIINADGSCDPDKLAKIQVDPKMLNQMTGISIGTTGDIIGIMPGDMAVTKNKSVPPWLTDITINPESNLSGDVKITMDEISKPSTAISQGWIDTFEVAKNSGVNGAYDFVYDNVSKTITAKGPNGELYSGDYKKGATVELKDALGNVMFTVKTQQYVSPTAADDTIGSVTYELTKQISLSAMDAGGNKIVAGPFDYDGYSTSIKLNDDISIKIDPSLVQTTQKPGLTYDASTANLYNLTPTGGWLKTVVPSDTASYTQGDILLRAVKEVVAKISFGAGYDSANFLSVDAVKSAVEAYYVAHPNESMQGLKVTWNVTTTGTPDKYTLYVKNDEGVTVLETEEFAKGVAGPILLDGTTTDIGKTPGATTFAGVANSAGESIGSASIVNNIYMYDANIKIEDPVVFKEGQKIIKIGDMTLDVDPDKLKTYFAGETLIAANDNPPAASKIKVGTFRIDNLEDWQYSGTAALAASEGGENVVIGVIALGKVPNMMGMSQDGESYFMTTQNSGDATFARPGKNGTGTLTAGYLEMSNVDISKEFTDMITTQRGFQANTRIITVSDEMLQELVNLKR